MVFTTKSGWPFGQVLHPPFNRAAASLGLHIQRSRVIHDTHSAHVCVAIEPFRIVHEFKAFNDLLAVNQFECAQLTDTFSGQLEH